MDSQPATPGPQAVPARAATPPPLPPQRNASSIVRICAATFIVIVAFCYAGWKVAEAAPQIRVALQSAFEDPYDRAAEYEKKGDALLEKQQFKKAVQNYAAALRIWEDEEDKNWIPHGYYKLGLAHHESGDYALAIEHLNYALFLYERLGDHGWSGIVIMEIGDVCFTEQKWDQAEEHYVRGVIRLYRARRKSKTGFVRAYRRLGHTCSRGGKLDKAEEYLRKGLLVSEDAKDDNLTGYVNLDLGTVEYRRGNAELAREHWEHALELFQKTHNESSQATARNCLELLASGATANGDASGIAGAAEDSTK